mmetsp:Transcript_1873/g.2062  ORF Transcript_1873/g.2062 Transcript_1873/m.2062 type:complete len:333 (+) Transcript_1873:72-1070(+)|eukprot:CAMPEP_0197848820 /NCGR_PEP_ID=MMETSP1438-20131217/10167_1 /TAXON_ID=1461541 /ORGANISM="Pterosperma sp., Strain CCMP1384" /LENGTH=332 /DNA_ID=CAMNT_0043461245 /DNA_START=68 /DNA_END=1066 /DNA_ORIENTATION=+
MSVAVVCGSYRPSVRHSLHLSSNNASEHSARLSAQSSKQNCFAGNTAVFRSTKPGNCKNIVGRNRKVVVKAVIGRIWGWFFDSSEDPEKMLDQALTEMEADLLKMRQVAAPINAQIKLTQKKYKAAQDDSNEWFQNAQMALAKGNEDLARRALERRRALLGAEESIKLQLDAQTKATANLNASIKALEAKLDSARRNKESLKARAASAKTTKEISEMIGGLGVGAQNSYAAFERMEEKVQKLEAEADSINIIAGGDNLEQDFLRLEAKFGDKNSEDELEKMKRQMFSSDPDRMDDKVDQLRKVDDAFQSMDDELDYEMVWLKKDLKKKGVEW